MKRVRPSVDKIVGDTKDYEWSSYQEILNMYSRLCDKSFIKDKFNNRVEFEKFMKDALPILKINKKMRELRFE